jgi:hypothetical protein
MLLTTMLLSEHTNGCLVRCFHVHGHINFEWPSRNESFFSPFFFNSLFSIFFHLLFQFVQRILILLMPVKHQPDYKFLRHVNLKRVHLFTILQILSTSLLFVIKYTDFIAISFPIMVSSLGSLFEIISWIKFFF